MSRLLRNVLCVIETFHKYASEDSDKATLTCRELKRLLHGEFGDLLQPRVMHTLKRNLNLLDVDNDGTISFDEFVLAIFSLLNLCYGDIQSLLSSEPRQVFKSEKQQPDEEHADLLGQATARNLPNTEKSTDPEDGSRRSETQAQPAQGRERETTNPPAQGGSRKVSGMPDVRAKREEGRAQEARGTAGQKERERKTEAQTHDGKYQELQESTKEKYAEKDSETQDLSSEERNQNHPETEGASIPGEEAKYAEKGTEDTFVKSRNDPGAKGTPGARERTQESEPLEKQSKEQGRRESSRTRDIHDKPIREDKGAQGEQPVPPVTQHEEGSCETPNNLAPEEGNLSSETREQHVQGDSQGRVDPYRRSEQGGHNNSPGPQKKGAQGENRVQEAVMLTVRGEEGHLPEDQEQPAREEHKSQGSGAAMKHSGHPEAQETTARGKNRKFPEAVIPHDLDADLTDQLSVTQLPKKENSRKEVEIQEPPTKEEKGGAQETQETLSKSQDEGNPASPETHLEAEEHETLEEEDGSPQTQAGEGDAQLSQARAEHSSLDPQTGFEEKMQRVQEPYSVERGAVQSSALYQYVQKKIWKETSIDQEEEHQKQAQEVRASGPELYSDQSRASLTSTTTVYFNRRQASREYTRELLPDEDAQQPSASRTQEDK